MSTHFYAMYWPDGIGARRNEKLSGQLPLGTLFVFDSRKKRDEWVKAGPLRTAVAREGALPVMEDVLWRFKEYNEWAYERVSRKHANVPDRYAAVLYGIDGVRERFGL